LFENKGATKMMPICRRKIYTIVDMNTKPKKTMYDMAVKGVMRYFFGSRFKSRYEREI
jgi:hypothetical protein